MLHQDCVHTEQLLLLLLHPAASAGWSLLPAVAALYKRQQTSCPGPGKRQQSSLSDLLSLPERTGPGKVAAAIIANVYRQCAAAAAVLQSFCCNLSVASLHG
jgi:hypothetical protein